MSWFSKIFGGAKEPTEAEAYWHELEMHKLKHQLLQNEMLLFLIEINVKDSDDPKVTGKFKGIAKLHDRYAGNTHRKYFGDGAFECSMDD